MSKTLVPLIRYPITCGIPRCANPVAWADHHEGGHIIYSCDEHRAQNWPAEVAT